MLIDKLYNTQANHSVLAATLLDGSIIIYKFHPIVCFSIFILMKLQLLNNI